MDKNNPQQEAADNAETLCLRIRQDADAQVKEIGEKQQADANLIIQQAQAEAQRSKIAALAAVEKELEKFREKAHSALNLEKRRLLLEGKSAFVRAVLDQVRRQAESFRSSPDYRHFLSQAVVEGAQVIESAQLEILYSPQDKHIFNSVFIEAATGQCSQALHTACSLRLTESDFQDIGLIVASQDGRMIFDNRFSARLARIYDQVYSELLKEA